MLKNLQNKIKKNFEIFGLIILIFFTVTFTSYFNYKKNLNDKAYNNFIDNIYLKKTLSHLIDNLERKYQPPCVCRVWHLHCILCHWK